MSYFVIIGVIVFHFFADFVLQTRKEATGKSENWHDLLSHTITYSIFWFFAVMFLFNSGNSIGWYIINAFVFSVITFVVHTITDYFTSRINKKLWLKGDAHNFFIGVGADQVLHHIQLFAVLHYINSL